jgi:hypothetical protein
LKYTLICVGGRLDVEMDSIEFLFGCTMYEQGRGNGIVRGLDYIYK